MRFFNEFVGKIPIRKMQCYVTIMVFDIKGGISKFKLIFFLSNFNAFFRAKICSCMWVIECCINLNAFNQQIIFY